MKSRILLRILLVLTLATCGCVRRFARIIATSTPPLARVGNSKTGVDYGTAPAFIDQQHRFFLLGTRKTSVPLTFELVGCPPAMKVVTVADWGNTADTGPQHVTEVHSTLQGCSHAGPGGY